MTTSVAALSHNPLPPKLQERVQCELVPGETVVWSSQPLAKKNAMQTIPIVLFGIPWTAFSVFWTWGAGQAFLLFGLFGVPFVVIGLLMLTSPLWAMRSSQTSAYVITNRRVLSIVQQRPGTVVVRSVLPAELKSMARTESADGSGSITYGADNTALFSGVANVSAVEQHLIKLTSKVSVFTESLREQDPDT
jgi:hypothetical protein